MAAMLKVKILLGNGEKVRANMPEHDLARWRDRVVW